jgi:glycosyltransferase 2 family protein
MSATPSDVQQQVNARKLLIPVSIGIAVSLYLLLTNFNPSALNQVHVTKKFIAGLLLGVLAMLVRDLAFAYKIRLSTGEKMPWLKTFQTIIMWEFGAAVSPKIGEVAFILFVLKRSGLTYGRSMAAILLNTFLDNLCFVIVFPLLYWYVGPGMFAISADCADLKGHFVMQTVRGFASKAWYGYSAFVFISAFLGIALFVLPHTTRKAFHALARIQFLSRIQHSIRHFGDEIELTANEYKSSGPVFYIKMVLATLVNWTGRYMLVVAIIFAFNPDGFNAMEVFARQYVLWIFMVIPTTPGSSGVAEIAFIALNCEFMPAGLSAAIALVWRIYSYYIYLVLGMLILPRWAAGPKKKYAAK